LGGGGGSIEWKEGEPRTFNTNDFHSSIFNKLFKGMEKEVMTAFLELFIKELESAIIYGFKVFYDFLPKLIFEVYGTFIFHLYLEYGILY
jgi:hypothetical protein